MRTSETELISKQLDMIAGVVFEIDNFDILKKKVEVIVVRYL